MVGWQAETDLEVQRAEFETQIRQIFHPSIHLSIHLQYIPEKLRDKVGIYEISAREQNPPARNPINDEDDNSSSPQIF